MRMLKIKPSGDEYIDWHNIVAGTRNLTDHYKHVIEVMSSF